MSATQAIRVGSERDESTSAQRDIDVRENVVKGVRGRSDANGAGVRGSSAVGVRASRTPPTGFRGADGRIYDDELGAVVPSALAGIPPVAPGGDAVGTVVLEVPVTAIDGGKVFVESSLSLESQRAWWQ